MGAFAYLLLGFFLYIDTHMEYMGCRQEVVLVGEPNTGPRLGHSAGSEISTYLSCTFVLASCAMGLLIWSMPLGDDAGGGGGGAKVSCAQQEATTSCSSSRPPTPRARAAACCRRGPRERAPRPPCRPTLK